MSLSPPAPRTTPGGTVALTVSLDVPASAGGTSVAIALNPANAGTVPAMVVVAAGQLSVSFNYVDGGTAATATVTATLGASLASATITITPATCSTAHLVISEIRSRGAAGASDEFVELYNPTNAPVTVDASWTLEARSNTATAYSSRWAGSGIGIPAHGHFLLASTGYTQTPAPDEILSTGLTDATSLRLMHSGSLVDAVCFGFDATTKMSFTTDTTFICEGAPATNPHNNATSTNVDTSIERKPGGASGNCIDTGDNDADFAQTTPATPQSSASPPTP